MIVLLLKLLLAHILGDFLFQPDKWVKGKEKWKHKSLFLYYHVLVHATLLLLVLQFDFTYWLGAVIILISHLIIDIFKANVKNRFSPLTLFLFDQLAHLLVIIAVILLYFPIPKNDFIFLNSIHSLSLVIFLLLLTKFSAVFLKIFMSKWEQEVKPQESLNAAGTYIGILERLLVFSFVVTNHWECIGFLLAAKSIFRFGDLSNAKDRKLTEYVLVGTLLSFTIAIAIALLYIFVGK